MAIHGSLDFYATRIYSWWQNRHFYGSTLDKIKTAILKAPKGKVSLLFSAHGLPRKYYDRGDPYVEDIKAHYHNTVHALLSSVKDLDLYFALSFQSKVGPVEWTKPYTEDMVLELGKKRGGHLLMVPISFTSDHLETLYEMDILYREKALVQGFTSYDRVLPGNSDPAFTESLYRVLSENGLEK
jgi:ferrochelatase